MVFPENTDLNIIAQTELSIHFWEEDAVVFNAISAETHLLDQFAAQILERLMQGPTTYVQLRDYVGKASADQLSSLECDEYLENLIANFQALDLLTATELTPT